MNKFTCDGCKKTFYRVDDENWNSLKEKEEFLNLYPECKNDLTNIVCDNCNDKFIKWFNTLTEEEKQRIRNEENDRLKGL